jgi:ZIP family zinc transporter
VIEAAIWGAIGASMLLVGAALAFAIDMPKQLRGLILAFGAGALFGAVAYELFEEAVRVSMGGLDVLFGFGFGAITFFLGSVAIDRLGSGRAAGGGTAGGAMSGGTAAGTTTRLPSRRDPRTDGLSVLLGTVLDGIPESVVLGASLIGGAGVGIPVLVAIAISNVPEGLSATEDLTAAGFTRARVVGLWLAVVAASTIAAGLGFAALSNAGPSLTAFVDAFAAGAILTMLAETMVPEAQEIGGRAVGLATSLGFAVAASLSFLT